MPTTSNGDCCVELMQGALVRPLARYPGSIAYDDPLKVASNRTRTTLVRNAGTGDTVLSVSDASRIVPQMLLTVDNEIVSVSAVDYSTNLLTVIRGFDGTMSACHSAGSVLNANIVAWHHNVLAAEITAIETALGPNLSNITGDSGTISSKYDFSAQSPGGNLVIGLNVVTLSPVPLGVDGANRDHYLYVSGGTGTAEACLISGGTAVPGAPSGTVFLTCANAHSGAWTIRSATAGIQEAIYSVGTAGSRVNVQLPPSTLITYAPVTVHGEEVCIYGHGQASIVRPQHQSGRVFFFTATGNAVWPPIGFRNSLYNFQIIGTGTGTVTGVEIRGQLVFRMEDVSIASTLKGVWVNDETTARSSAVWIRYCMLESFIPGTGVGFQQTGGADIFLVNNHIVNNPAGAPAAGILLTYSLGTKIFCNEVYGFRYGLLMQPGADQGVHAVQSIGNWYDSSQVDGMRLSPLGNGYITEIHSSCDRPAGSVGNGITIVGTDTNIRNVNIQAALVVHNGVNGIYYEGGRDVEFNDCHVFSNSRAASGVREGFLAASGGFRIHGGTYAAVAGLPGEGEINTQSWGIRVLTGPADNYIIEGVVAAPNLQGSIDDAGTGQNKIIRNNMPLQSQLVAAAVTGSTLELGTVPYEAVLVNGSATVSTITQGYPGRKIKLLKNDGGTITFNTAGNIHNGLTLAGNAGIVLAEFISTKWVLYQ